MLSNVTGQLNRMVLETEQQTNRAITRRVDLGTGTPV